MLHCLKKLLQNIFLAHFGPILFNRFAVENNHCLDINGLEYYSVSSLYSFIPLGADQASTYKAWSQTGRGSGRDGLKRRFIFNQRIDRRGNSLDHAEREQWESSSFPEHVVRWIEPLPL